MLRYRKNQKNNKLSFLFLREKHLVIEILPLISHCIAFGKSEAELISGRRTPVCTDVIS